MYLRLTRGHFDPLLAEQVAAAAADVAAAMERLPGLQELFQGMNASAGTVLGVSFWDTEEHARFPPEALGDVVQRLGNLGVRLDPPRFCELD